MNTANDMNRKMESLTEMNASFTRHAWSKVIERLTLAPADVADILNWDLAVNVGVEAGTRRVHRLFFSGPDDACFVAIQDEGNGAIVSVLPLDYHENLAWPVSQDAQSLAREMVGEQVSPVQEVPDAATVGRLPKFRLIAYRRTTEGAVRACYLGAWASDVYMGRAELLMGDDTFFEAVEDRLTKKGVSVAEIEVLYVRLGKSGRVTCINIATDN